jgi:hypothetical protein
MAAPLLPGRHRRTSPPLGWRLESADDSCTPRGIDLESRQQILPWLWADADLNLARGRFRDEPRGQNLIPLAPTITSTAGLTVRDAGIGILRAVDGGFRVRHVGARAAVEDDAVRAAGYTIWELFAGFELGRARFSLAVDNLFGASWNEAQFATTSRLRGESTPVTELNYTPGAPRSLQLGVTYRFY